jgi:predicted nucleic acid-binding protein
VIAVDTSVVVAAFASWHEGHEPAIAALAKKPRVPAHVLVESYSVLTRLPPPHRAPPDLVAEFLTTQFRGSPLVLAPAAHPELLAKAAGWKLSGGAIHDALIAETVRQAGGRLLTRDRRAASTYDRVGVDYAFA